MPENQEALSRPSIIVAEDASHASSRRISYIDTRIHEYPEVFEMSLDLIGEAATSQTVDVLDRGNGVRSLRRKPADLISEFFRERYDLDSEYDETTEQLIATDPEFRQLLNTMRSKQPERLQTGSMSSKSRPNKEAVPLRDQIRRKRLEIYLGQVTSYNNQQRQQAELPVQDIRAAF